MGTITTQRRAGRKSPFGPKEQPNWTVSLTRLGKQAASAAAERCGTDRSNVIELCLRRCAGQLTQQDFASLADAVST